MSTIEPASTIEKCEQEAKPSRHDVVLGHPYHPSTAAKEAASSSDTEGSMAWEPWTTS